MTEWIKLQEQMLGLHRQQMDAARKMADAAGHGIKLQKSLVDAAQANARAWDGWVSLWGGKR